MRFFTRKIKIVLVLLAMLISAVCGAFIALRISIGTEVGDLLVQRKVQERVFEKISRIRATQGDTYPFLQLELNDKGISSG